MPKIRVNTSRLNAYGAELDGILNRLNDIKERFNLASNNLDWSIKGEAEVSSILSKLSNELLLEAESIAGMRYFLRNAALKYDTAENSILGLFGINPDYKNQLGLYDIISNIGEAVNGIFGISLISDLLKLMDNDFDIKRQSYGSYFDFKKPEGLFGVFGTLAKFGVLSRKISIDDKNAEMGGSIEGSLLGGKVNTSLTSAWDVKKGNLNLLEARISADGHLAKGQVDAYLGNAKTTIVGIVGNIAVSGNVNAGLMKNGKLDPSIGIGLKAGVSAAKGQVDAYLGETKATIAGIVGNAAVSGNVNASLMKNGKLAPSIGIEGKAEASVVKGEFGIKHGSDKNDVHLKLAGEGLAAEASAKANFGKIESEDSDGNRVTKYGWETRVGAEAYLAKGKIEGGFKFCGIKVDLSVGGKLGGAGARLGGSITNSSASGEIGLGFVAGLGINVNVDWSNADLDIFNWFK